MAKKSQTNSTQHAEELNVELNEHTLYLTMVYETMQNYATDVCNVHVRPKNHIKLAYINQQQMCQYQPSN